MKKLPPRRFFIFFLLSLGGQLLVSFSLAAFAYLRLGRRPRMVRQPTVPSHASIEI